MLELLLPLSFCGLIFGLFFIIVLDPFGLRAKYNQKFIQHWEQIAPQIEFQFDGTQVNKYNRPKPTLTGSIHQFNCRIWAEIIEQEVMSEGRGTNITRTVDFEVYLPQSLELDLSIGPQGKHIPFLKFLSREELELDDKIFDQHFFVQGRDAAAVNQFLTLERKTTIYNASRNISPALLGISDTLIQARFYRNATPHVQEIINVMKQLVAIANTFNDNPPEEEEPIWESVEGAEH